MKLESGLEYIKEENLTIIYKSVDFSDVSIFNKLSIRKRKYTLGGYLKVYSRKVLVYLMELWFAKK